jgi:tRNA pseudouridine55 synthase
VTSIAATAGAPAAHATVSGVLALDKPPGLTSFGAVREVRRILGERRVGHAGTLDPQARGLLPVCVGRATRLVEYLHAQPKTYHCVVRLGERSDTFDTEGDVVPGADAGRLLPADVEAALQRFVGEVEQVPPMHSAVRHQGRHLYELARAGAVVERAGRTVTIHSVELVGFRAGTVAEAEIVVSCGKGTYMRVLAADLGEALGTGGLLGWLVRTRYGSLELESSYSLERLEALADPAEALLGLDAAVSHLPRLEVGASAATQLRRGQAVWLPRSRQAGVAGQARAHAPGGELLAVGELTGTLFKPAKVLVG